MAEGEGVSKPVALEHFEALCRKAQEKVNADWGEHVETQAPVSASEVLDILAELRALRAKVAEYERGRA